MPAYIPAAIGTVGDPPVLPWVGDGSAFLVGAYSFLPNEEKFNTAFAVYPDGEVPLPYFKQVLIPFGEYMPMASYFPWLNKLNDKAGVFSAGTETKVFAYPMRRADDSAYTLKVSPLICYEDTVPALAREAAREGAQLLVNISSDAWFGRSLAPAQHHLIAAFRAIENRRYLVRSTTTGLSAVVRPAGPDHRPDPAVHRGDRDRDRQPPGLSRRLHHLGRRPAVVGPARGGRRVVPPRDEAAQGGSPRLCGGVTLITPARAARRSVAGVGRLASWPSR